MQEYFSYIIYHDNVILYNNIHEDSLILLGQVVFRVYLQPIMHMLQVLLYTNTKYIKKNLLSIIYIWRI